MFPDLFFQVWAAVLVFAILVIIVILLWDDSEEEPYQLTVEDLLDLLDDLLCEVPDGNFTNYSANQEEFDMFFKDSRLNYVQTPGLLILKFDGVDLRGGDELDATSLEILAEKREECWEYIEDLIWDPPTPMYC